MTIGGSNTTAAPAAIVSPGSAERRRDRTARAADRSPMRRPARWCAPCRSRTRPTSTRRCRRRRGVSRLARHAAAAARAHPDALPRAAGAASARAGGASSAKSTARCFLDAMGSVQRGIEVVEFACGAPHLLKGEHAGTVGTRRRRALAPAAARRLRRHHAVQLSRRWCRCGCSRWRSPAATRSCSSRRRRTRRPRSCMAELLKEAGLPDGVLQRRARRQGRGRRDPAASRRQGGVVRRLDADREVHLRDGGGARQARAGARRREEPRGRAARRRSRVRRRRADRRGATARPASAAWRSRPSSPSATPATRWSSARAKAHGAQGRPRRGRGHGHGAARHARAPRQGQRATSMPASREGATLVVDGRGLDGRRARATASSSARRCSITSRRR